MIDRTFIVAGATGYGVWPDNSLEGARECMIAPVDGIEIDVQLTADGVVVAHHDYRLARNTTRLNGEWLSERTPPIKKMSYADLQRYDVGTLYPGSDAEKRYPHRKAMNSVRVPSLRDLFAVLNGASGPKRLFYIEIKTDPQQPAEASEPDVITDAVLRDVDAAGYAERTKIIAFDWQVLRRVREKKPDMATAHLTVPALFAHEVKALENGQSPLTDGADPKRFGGSIFKAVKAHGGMEWSPYYTEVNAETIAAAHAEGLKVGPWGLSKGEDIERMVKLGVWSATVSGPAWS